MILTKYQLAKYFNPQPRGGYEGVHLWGVSTHISLRCSGSYLLLDLGIK